MSRSAPMVPVARTTRTCTRRCGWPPWSPRSRAPPGSRGRAATGGRARALGLHKQIGKIAPGYKADIVFLDLHHINWIPTNDPVNGIVHIEDGTGVHSVMIGGRMVVENRQLLTVDLPKLAARIEAVQARRAKPQGEAKKLYQQMEKIVGTFCPGLAKAPLHIHRYGASHHAH